MPTWLTRKIAVPHYIFSIARKGVENLSPLVSIVTVFHNRKHSVKESVESILNQDYENIEYIIVDDVSTDGAYELIKSISHGKVKLIRNLENLGFTKSLIKAISFAKGKYLAIHGAGDVSCKSRIGCLVREMEQDDALGLIGSHIENYNVETGEVERHESIGRMGNLQFTHGEVMYRKSVYDHVGGYYSWCKFGQFSGLFNRIHRISKVKCVNEVLYKRNMFDDGVSKCAKKRFHQAMYISIENELIQLGGSNADVEELMPFVDMKKVFIRCFSGIVYRKGYVESDDKFLKMLRNHSPFFSFLFSKSLSLPSNKNLNRVACSLYILSIRPATFWDEAKKLVEGFG
jgi:glycosyltransferase involved in cell wall biosynthesis